MTGRLMSTTAVLMAVGMTYAFAQGVAREPNAPATAPNAQAPATPKAGAQQRPQQSMPQNRGNERGARQANPQAKDRDATTGQATPGRNPAEQHGQREPDKPKGQKSDKSTSQKSDDRQKSKGQQTQSNERSQEPKSQGAERSVDQQKQGAQRGDQPNQRGDRDQPKPNQDAQRGQQPGDQTVGQGAHANLSTEQRTRIRQTITKQSNAPRVTNVNFNISVGTVVPRTMRLAPLPVTVVEYVPRWRGYMYFLVGDEIIVVEPGTHRIVAVLPA
jgi:hypothetical protein